MSAWTRCASVVLLLVVGGLAGRGVHSSLTLTAPRATTAMGSMTEVVLPPETFIPAVIRHPAAGTEFPDTFVTAMTGEGTGAHAATLVSATSDVPAPHRGEDRFLPTGDRVLLLIQRMFPEADPETAKIWAESYADMELSELEFILEQKRLLPESLQAGRLASAMTEFQTGTRITASDDSQPLVEAIRQVSGNLNGFWSVGFRRTVLLPEVASMLPGKSDESARKFESLRFFNFDSGSRIASPFAMHVALPADDGTLMFRLEGDLLTRRGDFQVLADHRIGLITVVGPVALWDSPVLPKDATGVSISQSGEIQYSETSGKINTAGRVAVVQVPDLSQLTSGDGVIFVTTSSESLPTFDPDAIFLWVKTLELSNVNRENEQALLSHLHSLRSMKHDVGTFQNTARGPE